MMVIANFYLQSKDIFLPYICVLGTLVVSSSNTYSLVQVLFICIERYRAMTVTDTVEEQTWTRNVNVICIIAGLFLIIFNTSVFLTLSDTNSISCKQKDIFKNNFWIIVFLSISIRCTRFFFNCHFIWQSYNTSTETIQEY